MTTDLIERLEALRADAKRRIRTAAKDWHNASDNWGCETVEDGLTYWEWIDAGIDALAEAALRREAPAGFKKVGEIVYQRASASTVTSTNSHRIGAANTEKSEAHQSPSPFAFGNVNVDKTGTPFMDPFEEYDGWAEPAAVALSEAEIAKLKKNCNEEAYLYPSRTPGRPSIFFAGQDEMNALCDMAQAYLRGRGEPVAWISVSERLPEKEAVIWFFYPQMYEKKPKLERGEVAHWFAMDKIDGAVWMPSKVPAAPNASKEE